MLSDPATRAKIEELKNQNGANDFIDLLLDLNEDARRAQLRRNYLASIGIQDFGVDPFASSGISEADRTRFNQQNTVLDFLFASGNTGVSDAAITGFDITQGQEAKQRAEEIAQRQEEASERFAENIARAGADLAKNLTSDLLDDGKLGQQGVSSLFNFGGQAASLALGGGIQGLFCKCWHRHLRAISIILF